MSLILFNGSPRGKESNSNSIAEWFLDGYGRDGVTTYYLNKGNLHEAYAKEIIGHDQVLMIFPLYVDGMPGQVKHFFEVLASMKAELKDKEITFIIHSGFSEAIQNRALESYLNRVSDLLGFHNHGVIVIPGSEGFRLMPPNMTAKKRQVVSCLAEQFKNNQPFGQVDLKKLSGKEQMSKATQILGRILVPLGLLNFYWNGILKKNRAFHKRFDAPYWKNETPITSDSAMVIRKIN